MRGGLNRCCWCGTLIRGRKIRWCGQSCLLEYKVMTGCQSTIRGLVEARDRGVCSGCGLDTKILAFQLIYYQHAFRIGMPLHREALRCFFMTMIPWSPKDEARVYADSLKLLDALWERLLPGEWGGVDAKRAQSIYRRLVGSGTFIRSPLQHLWEADHIVAVEDGGGAGCGLVNFRTLCLLCHKKRSAEQAGTRAQRKKKPVDIS